MKKRSRCVVCAAVLGAFAAGAAAQEKSHDVLARPCADAARQNQRVLLWLTGDTEADASLATALRGLAKVLRDDYRVVALPSASVPGAALRKQLALAGEATPVLAVLDAERNKLGTLAGGAAGTKAFAPGAVASFLGQYPCGALDARAVLRDGLAAAAASERNAFVYLSAPW